MDFEQIVDKIRANRLEEIIERVLFDGVPFCFKDDKELYYTFRSEICKKLSIHPNNFAIIGSAKTGFSLSPNRDRTGKPFDNNSDIDVLLVSEEKFNEIWFQLLTYRHSMEFQLSYRQKSRFIEMQNIIFFGLIRMDKLSNQFDYAKEWWEFFNKLSIDQRFGKRRIRGAIYKSWNHASFYYLNSLKKLGESL